jgi:hypothetical protein
MVNGFLKIQILFVEAYTFTVGYPQKSCFSANPFKQIITLFSYVDDLDLDAYGIIKESENCWVRVHNKYRICKPASFSQDFHSFHLFLAGRSRVEGKGQPDEDQHHPHHLSGQPHGPVGERDQGQG